MYKRNTDILAQKFDAFIRENEQKILNMPFSNKQTDVRFVAWPLIARVIWGFGENVEKKVTERYFSDIISTKRDFFSFGIAFDDKQSYNIRFYGCDGIEGNDIGGYKKVFMSNMYGKRLQAHFHCGHNISQDAQLLLTIKAINGLPVSSLTEDEKETAAKAIESDYLKKENDTLFPKILVCEGDWVYWDIGGFMKEIDNLVNLVADELYCFIKKLVPKHLMGEYWLFVKQTSADLLDGMIEKCIELGTLIPPIKKPQAEGVLMRVVK